MTKGRASNRWRLAVAVGCAVALVGCGTVDAPISLRAKPPQAPPSARAADYARAVNLRPSDLPYFKVEKDEKDEGHPRRERRTEREVERCLGLEQQGDDEPLANVDSPSFSAVTPGAYLGIQSSVVVQRSSRGAAKAVRLLRSRRVAGCLRRVFVPVLEQLEPGGDVEISRVSIRRLRPPLPGVGLSFGFRISAIATVNQETSELAAFRPSAEPPVSRSLPMSIDLLTFIVGAAEVELTATATPTPASRVLERNLLTTLHERALAHRP